MEEFISTQDTSFTDTCTQQFQDLLLSHVQAFKAKQVVQTFIVTAAHDTSLYGISFGLPVVFATTQAMSITATGMLACYSV